MQLFFLTFTHRELYGLFFTINKLRHTQRSLCEYNVPSQGPEIDLIFVNVL